jgi:hypothetical protein
MRRLALATLLPASLCLLPATVLPATAFGASNVASTEAYVRANYALTLFGHGKIPTAEARLRGLRERLRRECPRVVAGSPQDKDSEWLTWEVIGAMTIVGYQPGAASVARFARAVSRLSWSNASITRAVHSYARQLTTEVRTSLPDVCGDLRAWKANGYTTLPASTVHFRKTFYESWVGIGYMPKAMLAPYLRPAQNGLLRRSRRFEEAIAEAEARAVETFGEIIDSLGLNQ